MTQDNLFHFVCAKCETHLSVDSAKVGAQAPCPKCGQTITTPSAIPSEPSGVSSIEKVKNAVENKPIKSEVKAVSAISVGDEAVNPRNGLTKSEEISAEFSAIVKLIVLTIIALVAVGLIVFYNQKEVVELLDKTF